MLIPTTTAATLGSQRGKSISAWLAQFYQFMSIHLWGNLPSPLQRRISKVYSTLYHQALSRYFIKPYCRLHYRDPDYLDQFVPPEGKSSYENFQDFFTRHFKSVPAAKGEWVWPCEGLLCHFGRVGEIPVSSVKGDRRTVETIFGVDEETIPAHYQFANVFLHNKNYHRIHAPVSGRITRIQHIPGDLVVLRPWIYRQNPSVPAFRNERINMDLEDKDGNTWFLSIIGGPAVGTIELPEKIKIGAEVGILDELAVFYLGSTCCIASPAASGSHREDQLIWLGEAY